MAKKTLYRECPDCHRLMSCLVPRCDCGRRFTGNERKFKVCQECGSLQPSSRLVCDCGHILIFDKREITPVDVEEAYNTGYVAGLTQERSRSGHEKKQAEHPAHICVSEQSLCEVYWDSAWALLNDLGESIPHGVKDSALDIVVGALTAWAELTLEQSRAESVEVVDTISGGDGARKTIAFQSADAVWLSLGGAAGSSAIPLFSGALAESLHIQPDIDTSAKVASHLTSFIHGYVEFREYERKTSAPLSSTERKMLDDMMDGLYKKAEATPSAAPTRPVPKVSARWVMLVVSAVLGIIAAVFLSVQVGGFDPGCLFAGVIILLPAIWHLLLTPKKPELKHYFQIAAAYVTFWGAGLLLYLFTAGKLPSICGYIYLAALLLLWGLGSFLPKRS